MRTTNAGFTLIELLIITVIIVMIAGIIVVSFDDVLQNTRVTTVNQRVMQIGLFAGQLQGLGYTPEAIAEEIDDHVDFKDFSMAEKTIGFYQYTEYPNNHICSSSIKDFLINLSPRGEYYVDNTKDRTRSYHKILCFEAEEGNSNVLAFKVTDDGGVWWCGTSAKGNYYKTHESGSVKKECDQSTLFDGPPITY